MRLWAGDILELSIWPSLSIYINVTKRVWWRGDERGKKVIFFYFVSFFWFLHEVEEISISALYRNNFGGSVQI